MILVDTSVWIDHLRAGEETLARLLETGLVLCHPFVIGEIALGALRQRRLVLDALDRLPTVMAATSEEVRGIIERHELQGSGIGLVDAHLLASAMLTPETGLWTRDKRLSTVAERLEIATGPGK